MDHRSTVTQCSELCNEARDTAQKLLNHYVRVQGLTISQVCRRTAILVKYSAAFAFQRVSYDKRCSSISEYTTIVHLC